MLRHIQKYFLIFFCFWATHLVGQDFKGKIMAGLNAAQVDGDEVGGYNQAGLLAGIAAEYNINDKTSFELQMRYSQKGSRSTQNQPFIEWRLNYLEIPVLVNYYVKEKVYIQGGLSGNVLINGKSDLSGGGGGGFIDETENLKDIDWNIHAGVGYLLSDNLAVHGGFSYSLGSFGKLDGVFNNTISVSLAYLLF